jgi:hypothetical protein
LNTVLIRIQIISTTARKRKNHFVAPTEYVDLIRIGLVERGLPTDNLEIASRGENFV